MKRMIIITAVALCVAVVSGCSKATFDVQVDKPAFRVAKANLDVVWDETLDVLREHNFVPDFQNRRFGRIETFPSVSQQWFEFWRADAQGWDQYLESSLHTIRRYVKVNFVEVDGVYDVELTVYVQRKTQLERQVTSASGALQIYRDKLPIYTGRPMAADEAMGWVDVGTDARLEKYLLGRILRRVDGDILASAADTEQ